MWLNTKQKALKGVVGHMEVLAVLLVLVGLVGVCVCAVMLFVRAVFKKGWEYKRSGIIAGIAIALFIAGIIIGVKVTGSAAKQDLKAGNQTAVNKTVKNSETKMDKEKTSPTQAPQTAQAPESKTMKDTYEEWLKKTITDAIGEKANTGKPRIESILFLDKDKTDMEITLWADDNLTPGFIRDGTVTKSAEVLRRIFSDPRAKRALLYWLLPVKDSYGQDKQMVIMQVVMTRETASKINWSGFNPLDLPDVADKFHVHPSLQ